MLDLSKFCLYSTKEFENWCKSLSIEQQNVTEKLNAKITKEKKQKKNDIYSLYIAQDPKLWTILTHNVY